MTEQFSLEINFFLEKMYSWTVSFLRKKTTLFSGNYCGSGLFLTILIFATSCWAQPTICGCKYLWKRKMSDIKGVSWKLSGSQTQWVIQKHRKYQKENTCIKPSKVQNNDPSGVRRFILQRVHLQWVYLCVYVHCTCVLPLPIHTVSMDPHVWQWIYTFYCV